MDVDADAFCVSFDFYLRNTSRSESFQEIVTELVVGDECVTEVLFVGVPTRLPVFNDTDTKTGGIYFFFFFFTSSRLFCFFEHKRDVRSLFVDSVSTALRSRTDAL